MNKFDRINLFGLKFSNINLKQAITFLTMRKIEKGYICFPSTNTISKAYKSTKLRNIFNGSLITFCDGKVTEFYLRIKGYKNIKNVGGIGDWEKNNGPMDK